MTTTLRRTSSRALALAVAPLLVGAALAVPTSAHAAVAAVGTTPTPIAAAPAAPAAAPRPTRLERRIAFGKRAVKVAASRRGSAYVYGASGPHRFDCSGLTMWTFKRLGHRLPHSSAAQYGRVQHIRASHRRAGDLVFFHDGGGIYHVAIYAGHDQIWHAPYTGARVRKERLWTHSVYYGRVRSA
ncbi:MAG: C40 family peptidase [Marmoricola sp.]